jgi:hypothetical protein
MQTILSIAAIGAFCLVAAPILLVLACAPLSLGRQAATGASKQTRMQLDQS